MHNVVLVFQFHWPHFNHILKFPRISPLATGIFRFRTMYAHPAEKKNLHDDFERFPHLALDLRRSLHEKNVNKCCQLSIFVVSALARVTFNCKQRNKNRNAYLHFLLTSNCVSTPVLSHLALLFPLFVASCQSICIFITLNLDRLDRANVTDTPKSRIMNLNHVENYVTFIFILLPKLLLALC